MTSLKRKSLLVLVPLISLALPPALAAAGSEAAEEVIAVLTRQAEDWNRGDLEAFTAVYAEDATLLAPSGVYQGRTEVLARYKKRYPDRAAMGRLSFEILETRASGDASLVTLAAHWKLGYPEDGDREDATGLTLLVLRHGADGWRILQDASM